MSLTVLIVDDQAAYRGLARAVLQADGYEVVGEAPSGKAALEGVRELAPDVVLLDVQMPGMDGFAVASRLSYMPDPPAVILVSSRRESECGPRVTQSGARGLHRQERPVRQRTRCCALLNMRVLIVEDEILLREGLPASCRKPVSRWSVRQGPPRMR